MGCLVGLPAVAPNGGPQPEFGCADRVQDAHDHRDADERPESAEDQNDHGHSAPLVMTAMVGRPRSRRTANASLSHRVASTCSSASYSAR